MLRYQDIFVPGGFPRHTYNARVDLQLEARLGEVRDNLCKLVTVTGQTKSGKTVLTRKVLPREEVIWIDGGSVTAEDEFWQNVVQGLELFQSHEVTSSESKSAGVSGKGSAGANFLIAKGGAELSGSLENERAIGRSSARTVSSRVAALSGLKATKRPIVIDDFHYLPRDTQGSIVRALKPLVFDGLPVAIIAIPHRRYDALKVEKEMTGRISPVEIPVWSTDELRYIPDIGFGLLNYTILEAIVNRLAAEAIGSPHLMQEFCRGICKQVGLEQAACSTSLNVNDTQLKFMLRDVAETIGRPIFEKLARGPQSRTDRILGLTRFRGHLPKARMAFARGPHGTKDVCC